MTPKKKAGWGPRVWKVPGMLPPEQMALGRQQFSGLNVTHLFLCVPGARTFTFPEGSPDLAPRVLWRAPDLTHLLAGNTNKAGVERLENAKLPAKGH